MHLAETKLHKWHQAEVGSIFTILAGPIQTVDTGYACVSKNGSEKKERTKEKVKEERKEGAMEKCILLGIFLLTWTPAFFR